MNATSETIEAGSAGNSVDTAGGTHDLVLPEQATIKSIDLIKGDLLQALDNERTCIDAGQVSTLDTAVLQALVGFINEATANSHAVEWKSVSPTVTEVARFCGLTQDLML